jgi:hypothetical protein
MNRSMEVDRSFDNVPFNGWNNDEDNNESDDEENENRELLFESEASPLEPEIPLGRPQRKCNRPPRFLPTPSPPLPNRGNIRNPNIPNDVENVITLQTECSITTIFYHRIF